VDDEARVTANWLDTASAAPQLRVSHADE